MQINVVGSSLELNGPPCAQQCPGACYGAPFTLFFTNQRWRNGMGGFEPLGCIIFLRR